ncbi:hypothetical protein WICPIJ_003851 [Wickerhamomyces pijperi]|uniref:1-acyl-sn-glycerol-3-phosphate acyltransferase n=1 Tax=Wickerhamomyces pijperi TaxID=599730 RepID=A0A9P8TNH7_WICPI|nr:hypothetical protein WICPIJ_003851 [Wickerhamomyces pijperi]
MPSFLQRARFYAKFLFANTVLGGCAIYGFLCSVVLAIAGKSHLSQYSTARVYYYTFSTLLGIRIRLVNGEALEKLPAVIVGNHQSILDILILGRIFPPGCSVTSKKSLSYVPFLGWFMTLSGAFFIDRKNGEAAKKILNDGLENLKKNKRAIFLFAEGKRSYATEPTLLPLKKGAFHMATQAQIPVVPLVASNYSNIYDFDNCVFESGEIVVKVLDPVSTEGLTKDDVNSLTERVQGQMLETVMELGYAKSDVDEPVAEDNATTVAPETTATEDEGVETEDTVLPNTEAGERSSLLSKTP